MSCIPLMIKNDALLRKVFSVSRNCIALEHGSSKRCNLVAQPRPIFPRMYKTTMVLQDGSTVTVRCREPRKILKMPIDMPSLTDKERTNLWFARKGEIKGVTEVKLDSSFSSEQYSKYFKK